MLGVVYSVYMLHTSVLMMNFTFEEFAFENFMFEDLSYLWERVIRGLDHN